MSVGQVSLPPAGTEPTRTYAPAPGYAPGRPTLGAPSVLVPSHPEFKNVPVTYANECNSCGVHGGFLRHLFSCPCKPEEEKNGNGKNGNGNGNGKDANGKNGNGKDGNGKDGNGNGDGEKEKDDGPWRLVQKPVAGFNVTGWIYGTGVANATNGSSRYNGPLTMNDQEGVFLNQFWLNFNKPLEKDCFSVGANLDVFFGNDYLASLSRGFENARARGVLPRWWNNQDYGIAIPQAYLEFGHSKLNMKVGHFYTPHGYMVIQAPSNFFNTLPYGFMMTNPFTHWGAQLNAAVGDQTTVMFAIVNGWDALDRPTNAAAYMGGVKYAFKEDKGFISCNVITGLEPENLNTGYDNRTLVTNVLDYKLNDRVEFVFENNLLWQDNRGLGTSFSHSYIPYLFYKINDCWRIGARYEYFRDPGGFIAASRAGNPNNGPFVSPGIFTGDMHSLCFGLNWAPHGSKNLMIRPEVRYDWFDGAGPQPFNGDDHQLMFVLGAWFQF